MSSQNRADNISAAGNPSDITFADSQSRTVKLIGQDAMDALRSAHVLIVGIGGVGGSVFEHLVRCGTGKITVVDGDAFDASNLNRQILCTRANVGLPKVAAAAERARQIGYSEVRSLQMRFEPQTADEILACPYNYVADCIDSVKDKVLLISECKRRDLPIVSAMGAGNRTECEFCITDIFSTQNDALARVMRKELRGAGIGSLDAVCDKRVAAKFDGVPGSISYAPNIAGCVMAGFIARELIKRGQPCKQ